MYNPTNGNATQTKNKRKYTHDQDNAQGQTAPTETTHQQQERDEQPAQHTGQQPSSTCDADYATHTMNQVNTIAERTSPRQ
eukprot:11384244-Prorocentrum_lima.AAC.1